jgi:catechol 2,3-dioxygenase-like lactoylglutathione lyase family enzyme
MRLIMKFRLTLLLLIALVPAFQPLSAQQPPSRPKIFGIAAVQIIVSDMRSARDFYSKVLNRSQIQSPVKAATGIGVPVNDAQMVVLTAMDSGLPANLLGEITFATSDVQALRRYLEFHKVEVNAPQGVNDKSLTVSDPEGHTISFVEWNTDLIKELNSKPMTTHLIHAGFVVRDRAAEDKFYKDILGFHVYWHGGMKEGEDNWVDMQVPDGTDWIEYMLRVSPEASHKTLGVMNHIALGVPDIQAAEAQLIKNGFKPTEEPKIGRDGKWQLNLYDPDETRVELMEFKPTKDPCCSPYTGPHPGPAQ